MLPNETVKLLSEEYKTSDLKPMIDGFLKYAEWLVHMDEANLALTMLDCVPAFFRDYRIKEIEDLKTQIHSFMCLPHELISDERELPKNNERNTYMVDHTQRFQLIIECIESYNKKGIVPHIVDYGPGDFVWPLEASRRGKQFTYEFVTLNQKAAIVAGDLLQEHILPPNESAPIVFVAFEIIEHLKDPFEIKHLYSRISRKPEKIFLSTPLYTYYKGESDWKKDGIHHIRAFTPKEFIDLSTKLFPFVAWEFRSDRVMTLISK